MNIIKGPRAVDANKLDRWIGGDTAEHISKSMLNWYGPPIALGGVPGNIFVHKGGDITGNIRTGLEATALDYVADFKRRMTRGIRAATRANQTQFNMGFSSLSDLISEATNGKRQEFIFSKTGNTTVTGATSSLWRLGAQPASGVPPTTANGTPVTSANTGAFPFSNAAGGDSLHFVGAYPTANLAGTTLLMYDRLTHHLKTASSTASESVANAVTRYANTTIGTVDYAAGNFLFMETGGATMGATAHNWTVCQYTDQDGNTAQTLPTIAGNSGNIGDRLDMPVGTWFAPLAAGDTGIKALTQMQSSASVTGALYFVVGHPIAWMPCPVANIVCQVDGINTAFNLARIFDGAALSFLEVCKPGTTSTIYTGTFTLVSG